MIDTELGTEKNEAKNKLRHELLEILKEWALYTTAHGFGNVVRANNIILKIIWILFLIGFWVYCSYLIVLNIISFYQYETTTTLDIYHEVPTLFPTIDICNLNPYDGQEARMYMIRVLETKNITFNLDQGPKMYTDVIIDQIKAKIEEDGNNNVISLWDFGFYMEQMLISCKFQGISCSDKNFTWYHNYHYGSCYRFNSGYDNNSKPVGLKSSTKAGQRDGLQLELYVGDPITQQQFTYKSGVRVIIHNQTVIPFPEEDGLDAATGQETNIAITKTFVNRLPYPYSSCVQTLTNSNIHSNRVINLMKNKYDLKQYDQKTCIKICQQLYIIQVCKCSDLSIPYFDENQTKGCTNVDQVKCMQTANLQFFNSDSVSDCYENCPIECNSVKYDTQVSISNYPTQWYSNLFNNWTNSTTLFNQTPTFAFLQQTTLMLNVFYGELNYNVVEQIPAVTLDSLMAYIGGTFGLFLGTSILSLGEVLEIIFLEINCIYKHKFGNKININSVK